jgi:hypothetical protein
MNCDGSEVSRQLSKQVALEGKVDLGAVDLQQVRHVVTCQECNGNGRGLHLTHISQQRQMVKKR